MKLLLIVCVLALAATPGQAQSPGSFRVLDKINGILEKELNVLNGDSSQMSSQVALRGTSQNFMQVRAGAPWTTFADGAKKKYDELKNDATDLKAKGGLKFDELKAKGDANFDKAFDAAKDKFTGGMVWAKSTLDKHPYRWMAFKVGVTIVTTIICPACAFVIAASFAVIDSVAQLSNLKDAANDLAPGLSDEAKAACMADASLKTLMVIAGAAVNIFVPIPMDAGGGAAAAVTEIFGKMDFSPLLDSGVAEAAKGGLAAMGKFVKDVIAGAAGEAANSAADKVIAKIKAKGGKMAKVECSKIKALKDETYAEDDKDTPKMSDGFL